jgi:ADP-ribose pyrophosphatase
MQTIQKWEELSRETVFHQYGRGVEKVAYRLPNGKETDFYIKKEGRAACVVALTKDNRVIVTKQFRPGPDEILLELPGGGVGGDETPEEAVERELLEETGYRGNIQFVGKIFHDAYSTNVRHCFVATECEKVADQNLDENEQIEVVLLTLPEFRELLRSGKMTDVESGYRGMDFLGLL